MNPGSLNRLAELHRLLGMALIILPSALPAQPILILNAGFESNSITPGAFVVLQPQSWVNHDPGNIINGFNNAVGVIRPSPGTEYFPAGAPELNNAALIFLAGPESTEVGLQQTLSATLQGGRRYRLSAMVGNIASGTSLPGSSGGAGVYFDLDGFPGYRLDLLAGGAIVAADTNSIGASIPEGEFRRVTMVFDCPTNHPRIGQALGVRVVNLKQPGTPAEPNIEVDFDDVQLSAGPIPEAAQLALALNGPAITLTITGTTGATYRVEHSPTLPATNWIALTNLTLNASPANLLDLPSSNPNAAGFYRAVAH